MTLDDILLQARKVGASDVHVSVGIPIKCRIHGTLQDLTSAPLNGEDTKTLIQQMIPKRLVASFNETGEADFSYAIPGHGRFRVNVFKQKGSMAFVIRLINTEIPEPESLGLTPSVIDLINKKRGLILVTGPTGSGKSTTLYTVLNELNGGDVNIITVEDPVEADVDGINQVDTFMLTMAMTALGAETSIDKFRKAGAKPFVLASILYIWLIAGGYFLVKYMAPIFM